MSVPELDLAFLVDCTGSMGQYIEAAQKNIVSIAEKLQASEKRDLRFALVCYRDHPPQDRSYVTRVFKFTESLREMKRSVDTMSARGGGDGPESVSCGFKETLNLDWRGDATKICIFIADAPPHGLEPAGDGFPNGCPDKNDALVVANQMVERGICVYSVSCEPVIGRYRFARDFMKAVSIITEGQMCALAGADALADVIIAGAEEEASLAKVMEKVESEMSAAGLSGSADAARDRAFSEQLAERMADVQTNRLELDQVIGPDATPHAEMIAQCPDLKVAKENLKDAPRTTPQVHTFAPTPVRGRGRGRPAGAAPSMESASDSAAAFVSMPGSFGPPPAARSNMHEMPVQCAKSVRGSITADQVQRVMMKSRKSKR